MLSLLLMASVCSFASLTAGSPVGLGRKTTQSRATGIRPAEALKALSGYTGKPAYAILTFGVGENVSLLNRVVKFPLQPEPSFTVGFPFYQTATAGAYADGYYYIASTRQQGQDEVPDNLVRVDLEGQTSTTVGALQGVPNFFNDMTYDYATSTMFAVSRNAANSASVLYKINLTDASTAVVATLDRRFFTLACTYDGVLYGVSFEGDFCRIDKQSGIVTVVGPTGFNPNYFQSMEFDHSDGTLYWTPNVIKYSGSIEVESNMLATIDVNTGQATELGILADDIQLAGLYIPFVAAPSAAPAAPSQFRVVPDADGANKAVLSWTNPVKTFGGATLAGLASVEVVRNEEVIHTFTMVQPGASMTYTDNLPAAGEYTYRVIARNDAGAGVPAQVTTFVGMDVPGAPRSLSWHRDAVDGVTLSWQAPETGADGGLINPASLTYRVYRDSEILIDNLQETSYSDAGITPLAGYTYRVCAVNAKGEGEAAVTPVLVLGPALEMPYDCNFSLPSMVATWSFLDADADGNTWKCEYLSAMRTYFLGYRAPSSQPADDWAVSHAFSFKQGVTYKVGFGVYSFGMNDFTFNLLSDTDPSKSVQQVGEFKEIKYYQITPMSFTFTASQTGLFHVGIHAVSQANTSWLYITDFHIEEIAENNLAAVSLGGTDSPVMGNTYRHTVTVANKGTLAQTQYTVYLKDQNGSVLGQTAVNETLEPNATKDVAVEWTVTDASLSGLTGEVSLQADGIAADNRTDLLPVTVQPAGSADKISIGMNSTEANTSFPFTLSSSKGANQNLYLASEIGYQAGWINKLTYVYNSNATKDVVEVPVKVYLANTDRTDNQQGWIPASDYTLVYEGNLSFHKGQHQVDIPFSQAYYYKGENLAVLTVHAFDGYNYSMGIAFPYYSSPVSQNRAIGYGGNLPFDFTQYTSSRMGNSSVVMQILASGSSIRGVVTDLDAQPLPGSRIRVVELGLEVEAGETGEYRIDYLPQGSYTIECNSVGYPAQRKENVQVGKEDTVLNFTMHKLASYSVSGRVLSPDGQPLADAHVRLDGYFSSETTTAADGTFSFGDVLVHDTNRLTVTKDWYQTAVSEFAVTDQAVALSDITLSYYIFPPVNVKAQHTEGRLFVDWEEAFAVSRLQKDNGQVASQFGLTAAAGMSLIGTIFREPIMLEEVSWYTTSEGGPHNTVNLYIFALDAEGKPTAQQLYAERSIRNTDGQWTTHTLSAPVMAPHGCVVSLNYPGFLGIAIDEASREHPYAEQTYVFSTDYTQPVFDYLEDLGLGGNLFIRASGSALPANIPEGVTEVTVPEQPSGFVRYKVWRMTDDARTPADWVELTPEGLADTEFVDEAWEALSPAVYRYAIRALYPDGTLSDPVYTACVTNNMDLAVTLSVQTNSASQSAEGARVTLTDADGKTFAATVDATGRVHFADLWKGEYRLHIALPGYEEVTETHSWTEHDEYTPAAYVLKEIIGTPFNLSAKVSAGEAQIFWNELGDLTDDFEAHPDFEVASAGAACWTYLDADGSRTYAPKGFDFPHSQQPMSYIVFNPSATTPAFTDSDVQPYSGKKFLACFNAINGNDDYLFSPCLNYHEGGTIRFMAKSYTNQYQDAFRVGYSMQGTDPTHFEWFDKTLATSSWQPYSYNLPAGTQYVSIHCVSGNDGFILMLDDIRISSGKQQPMVIGNHAPEVTYELSLDGEPAGTTTDTRFTLTDLKAGSHRVGVTARYHSGVSQEAFVELEVASGLDAVSSALVLTPNPASHLVHVQGDVAEAALYDGQGRCVAALDAVSKCFDVSQLAPGIYFVRAIDSSKQHRVLKLQVVR